MRIKWDEKKRREVLQKRGIDFAQLEDLFCIPYIEDQRNDDPEQYRIIGLVPPHRLMTLIVEYREVLAAPLNCPVLGGGHYPV